MSATSLGWVAFSSWSPLISWMSVRIYAVISGHTPTDGQGIFSYCRTQMRAFFPQTPFFGRCGYAGKLGLATRSEVAGDCLVGCARIQWLRRRHNGNGARRFRLCCIRDSRRVVSSSIAGRWKPPNTGVSRIPYVSSRGTETFPRSSSHAVCRSSGPRPVGQDCSYAGTVFPRKPRPCPHPNTKGVPVVPDAGLSGAVVRAENDFG